MLPRREALLRGSDQRVKGLIGALGGEGRVVSVRVRQVGVWTVRSARTTTWPRRGPSDDTCGVVGDQPDRRGQRFGAVCGPAARRGLAHGVGDYQAAMEEFADDPDRLIGVDGRGRRAHLAPAAARERAEGADRDRLP